MHKIIQVELISDYGVLIKNMIEKQGMVIWVVECPSGDTKLEIGNYRILRIGKVSNRAKI